MSTWMDMAASIKTRLESLSAVGDTPVVIDRQKDIDAAVDEAVGKATGVCITILFLGAQVVEDAMPMVTRPRFQIRLYALPIILNSEEHAVMADDVLEAMLPGLAGWHPNPNAHSNDKIAITSDPDILPDQTYLIYEFEVTCRTTLAAPAIKPPSTPDMP